MLPPLPSPSLSQNAVLTLTKQNLLQAEAIGARYAASWSAKHTTAAVAHVNGSGKGGGAKGGTGKGGDGGAGGSTNPLLAGTKFDPFAANGGGDKEALDAPLEELGQTFEVRFIAPLKQGERGHTRLAAHACAPIWLPCS